MAEPALPDEFERLLKSCEQQLSGIGLKMPGLEAGNPPPPAVWEGKLTLDPPAVPAPVKPASVIVEPKDAPPPAATASPPAERRGESAQARTLPAVPGPNPQLAPAAGAVVVSEKEAVAHPRIDIFPAVSSSTAAGNEQGRILPSSGISPTTLAIAATVAAAALALLGAWLWAGPPADLTVNLPGAEAMAVRWENDDLLVARGRQLDRVDLDGRVMSHQPLETRAGMLLWAQGFVWVADGLSKNLLQLRESRPSVVYRLNHIPVSISGRENEVWTLEKDSRRFHQYLIGGSILGGKILQPLDSYESPEISPTAVSFDDAGILWAIDGGRSLCRLRLGAGGLRVDAMASLKPFLRPEESLAAFSVHGGQAWIFVQSPGKSSVRRFRLSRLQWDALPRRS